MSIQFIVHLIYSGLYLVIAWNLWSFGSFFIREVVLLSILYGNRHTRYLHICYDTAHNSMIKVHKNDNSLKKKF